MRLTTPTNTIRILKRRIIGIIFIIPFIAVLSIIANAVKIPALDTVALILAIIVAVALLAVVFMMAILGIKILTMDEESE